MTHRAQYQNCPYLILVQVPVNRGSALTWAIVPCGRVRPLW